MAISGLVVTLADDASAEAALSRLGVDPRLTLGEQFGRRLAVVAETPDAESDRALWDDLLRTVGVTNVDVTSVYLDREHSDSAPQAGNHTENQHAHR